MNHSLQAWLPQNRSGPGQHRNVHSSVFQDYSVIESQRVIQGCQVLALRPCGGRRVTSPTLRRYFLLHILFSSSVTPFDQSEPPPSDEAHDAMYAE